MPIVPCPLTQFTNTMHAAGILVEFGSDLPQQLALANGLRN